MLTFRNIFFLPIVAILLWTSYTKIEKISFTDVPLSEISVDRLQTTHFFMDTVKIKDYFNVIDSIVSQYDSLLTYPISEHLLIRNNPWVIDSLAATDYYRLKDLGIINLNPKELPIFRPADSLVIPDSAAVDSLIRFIDKTYLDLNIPEFKLRILHSDSVLYEFPVRVGRNEQKYLAMAGKVLDLRTKIGNGIIVRHSKDPVFINPSNNHVYYVTQRDDGTVTGLPNIPWIEPEMNGVRYGQLIHPTTNIETLGKAYSNGCIGTSEAAAWQIYYHAPIGTRIIIRYDLEVVNENGDTVQLQNIYNW